MCNVATTNRITKVISYVDSYICTVWLYIHMCLHVQIQNLVTCTANTFNMWNHSYVAGDFSDHLNMAIPPFTLKVLLRCTVYVCM